MSVNTSKIAKNTIMLYIRMLLMMVVTLYTSRVILQVLGLDDFGIYNLVAGFVTLFSFISRALTTAVQRFFNVALGRNDKKYFQSVFSASIIIFIIISLIVLIVGETIGVWIIKSKLINIPECRIIAAQYVFHTSLFLFILSLLRIPYNASIIAHEKMDFYAYVSIIETILKLVIVYILQIFNFDKLILYAFLLLLTTVIVNLIYLIYCRCNFKECRYRYVKDKGLFGELFSFSGWSMFGQLAVVARAQGVNLFVNSFFSVSVNAAQGISSQVAGALNQLVSNFQTAFNPQLVQTYASGVIDDHTRLLYRACKFSYYLLLLLVVPVSCNLPKLLEIWLTVVPPYSVEFCRLSLMSYLILSLSSPFVTTIFANGAIRGYQISLVVIHSCDLLLSFFVLKLGLLPYYVAVVNVFIQIIFLVVRIFFAIKVCPIRIVTLIKDVMFPILLVTILSFIVPLLLTRYDKGIIYTLFTFVIDVVWTMIISFFMGMNKNEQMFLISRIKSVINNIR